MWVNLSQTSTVFAAFSPRSAITIAVKANVVGRRKGCCSIVILPPPSVVGTSAREATDQHMEGSGRTVVEYAGQLSPPA